MPAAQYVYLPVRVIGQDGFPVSNLEPIASTVFKSEESAMKFSENYALLMSEPKTRFATHRLYVEA